MQNKDFRLGFSLRSFLSGARLSSIGPRRRALAMLSAFAFIGLVSFSVTTLLGGKSFADILFEDDDTSSTTDSGNILFEDDDDTSGGNTSDASDTSGDILFEDDPSDTSGTSTGDNPSSDDASDDILFEDPDLADTIVDFRFLNTQTDPSLAKRYSGSTSNIIHTKDDKYILIDTGDPDPAILAMIKTALQSAQSSTGSVTIDVLVISHLDSDHVGNAADLISDPDINVKAVVIKQEGANIAVDEKHKNFFDNTVAAAIAEGATLYTNATTYKVNDIPLNEYAHYSRITQEGVGNASIPVGNYLHLYLYNTRDVYHGLTCEKGYGTHLTSDLTDPNILKDSSGRYQVLDNTSGAFPNLSLTYISDLKNSGSAFNQVFYRQVSSSRTAPCRSNPNSIGVLVGISAFVGEKYAYFPGDMDNWGYGFLPETTDITYYAASIGGEKTATNHKIYGNGIGVLYKSNSADDIFSENVIENSHKIPSETKVALEIADRLGSQKDDLVLYQLSHHGANNAPDAIELLGLNRSSGVYFVNNRANNIGKKARADFLRTYHYTLGNVPASRKLYTGHASGEGVYCIVTEGGESKCSYSADLSTDDNATDPDSSYDPDDSDDSGDSDTPTTPTNPDDPDPTPTLSNLITNDTAGIATVTPTSSTSFTVTSETPCLVLLSTDSGATYTRLSSTAVSGQLNSRSYSVSDPSSASIVVALAGDVNNDHSLDVRDARLIIQSVLGKTTLNSRQSLIADTVNSDGVNVRDARAIVVSILNSTSLSW